MKWLLQTTMVLASCLVTGTMAQSLAVKTVELGHPANGDVARIGDSLAVSGHSAKTRWLSLIDLDDYAVRPVDIPPDAQFFSYVTLAGKDTEQMVFLTSEGVVVYAPDSGKLRRLVQSPSIFPVTDTTRLGYRHLASDLNGSGLSDLLIPDFTAYHLYIQTPEGHFRHFPLALDVRVRTWQQNPRYIPRQPYPVDINLDGRTDLAFVRDGALLVFAQQADGSFPEQPRQIELTMPLSPDNEAEIRTGDGRDYENLRLHRMHDFLDLDGDGLADLVIREEAFDSVVEQRHTYRIYYGRKGEAGLEFGREHDTHIETYGIQFEPVFTDVNGDGRMDFYTPNAQIGVGTIIRTLLSGSAPVNIDFYLMDESRRFGGEPDHRHSAKGEVSIGAGRFDLPLVTVASLDGGGAKSLLVGEGRKELSVHAPSNGGLFERRSTVFATPLPRDGSRVRVIDLNDDGKDDIVLPFDAQEDPDSRNQVRLLLTQ